MTTEIDSLPGEEWREVVGYPNYRVSNMGRVQSNFIQGTRGKKTGDWRFMAHVIGKTGYPTLGISRNGRSTTCCIHSLVLEAFVGPREKGMTACHCNGKRDDNRLENLRWDTYKGNEADKVAHGTTARGEKNGHAKLTNRQAVEIRKLIRDKQMPQTEMARLYGVSESTISDIKNFRRFKHVDDVSVKGHTLTTRQILGEVQQ